MSVYTAETLPMKTYIQIGFSIVYLPLTTVVGLVLNCEKMESSAVLLFTAAALLLVLAELGQSAPAQDQFSGPQREAIQKYYWQLAKSQEENYYCERLAQMLSSRAAHG